MAYVVYRDLRGVVMWVCVRELLADACKRALREAGTPAVAVMRRKRPVVQDYD